MSPLPQYIAEDIEKRWIWGYYDDDGSSGWYTWGRWVLLGVIIGVALLIVFLLQCTSCQRVRHGRQPIQGTGWMVPPSYYASQQEYQNDPLPVYKAQPGEGDAAMYNGNQFVPVNHENQEYAPPEGPPPAHMRPPSGPPPSQTMPNVNSDYYRPPAGPPPGHADDIQAPLPAKH